MKAYWDLTEIGVGKIIFIFTVVNLKYDSKIQITRAISKIFEKQNFGDLRKEYTQNNKKYKNDVFKSSIASFDGSCSEISEKLFRKN